MRQEVERLVSSLLDRQLDAPGVERLESLLAEEPLAREVFLNCVELHVLLESRHETKLDASANDQFEHLASQLMGEPNLAWSSNERMKSCRADSARPRNRLWWAAARFALAAGVLVAVALGWRSVSQQNERAAAPDQLYAGVLSRAVGARWASADAPLAVPARLVVGQRLSLDAGYAELALSSGCTCALKGPAEVVLVSPMCVQAISGALWARVGEEAKGFVIETPSAKVVDLGTEFGVSVDDANSTTDVVVFEGAVDLELGSGENRNSRTVRPNVTRLTSGEALRVEQSGVARRIVSVKSEQYPRAAASPTIEDHPCLIGSVADNIRDPNATMYYQIVRAGLFDDARAYVDRKHEWNGVDESGIPSFLRGADYLMCFNSDKWIAELEISVAITAPARLFVLFDERLPVPEWLARDFVKTDAKIGVDEGPAGPAAPQRTDYGPGKSIDTVYSVWQRDVLRPGTIKFGALPKCAVEVSMYGIAATPLVPSTVSDDKTL